MALDKRAWRCQKGHGVQEKGHGAAPCYSALDLTLAVKSQYMDTFHLLMVTNDEQMYAKILLLYRDIFYLELIDSTDM